MRSALAAEPVCAGGGAVQASASESLDLGEPGTEPGPPPGSMWAWETGSDEDLEHPATPRGGDPGSGIGEPGPGFAKRRAPEGLRV